MKVVLLAAGFWGWICKESIFRSKPMIEKGEMSIM